MIESWPSVEDLTKFHRMPYAWIESKAAEYDGTAVSHMEVPTLVGKFGIGASAIGVAAVFFPGFDNFDIATRMDKYGMAHCTWGKQRAIEAGLELMGYLLGEITDLKYPADLSYVTPFQRDVFTALREVPHGETITYGELARLAGHPGKTRAVGSAMRYNPIPIFVPCHRVISASGELGGWSGPEGWKEWLLELEGWTIE